MFGDEQLTDKQKLFIEHYLVHMNATKAAKLAGYSEKTAYSQGARMLKNVEIREALDAAFAERFMGKNEVLVRLAEHARGDMGEFAHVTYISDIQEHPQARLIKKYKRTIRTDKDDVTTENIELELYDAQTALVQIGRYHKLFAERLEHTGKDGGPIEAETKVVIYIPDNGRGDNPLR